MLGEHTRTWVRVSGIDDKKHVYRCDGLTVAFSRGKILPHTTANTKVTCRVIETYNNTIEQMHLFDNKRDALSELIVDEDYTTD